MYKENFVASFRPEPEPRSDAIRSLADLGFREGKTRTGIVYAPLRQYAGLKASTGERIYGMAIDYPVAGLYLENLLHEISPAQFIEIPRLGTRNDWDLPDYVDDGDPHAAKLHAAHMQIPGYGAFDNLHRKAWIKALDNERADQLFIDSRATRFIDSKEHVLRQEYQRKKEWYGEYLADTLQFGEPASVSEEDRQREFNRAFHNGRQKALMLIDPVTGRGFKQYLEDEPVPVSLGPLGKFVVLEADGVSTQITLGEIDEGGFYKEDNVQFRFPPGYEEHAVKPLIAWKESKDGKRSFLTDEEVSTDLPEGMTNGYDALLGRAVAINAQPNIGMLFPDQRRYREGSTSGPQQRMMAAQVPVLLYQDQLIQPALETDVFSLAGQSLRQS